MSSTNLLSFLNVTFAAVTDGAPFGAGYSAFLSGFGEGSFDSGASASVSNNQATLRFKTIGITGFYRN